MLTRGVSYRIQLDEQDRIDGIITGKEHGHYYLLIGEKVGDPV